MKKSFAAIGLPGLYRETERRRIRKLEAGNRMGDPRRAPVVDSDIDPSELEPHSACLPMWSVVGFAAVIAVADIVESHFIAIDLSLCQIGPISLPLALVAGFQSEPPCETNANPVKMAAIFFLAPRINTSAANRAATKTQATDASRQGSRSAARKAQAAQADAMSQLVIHTMACKIHPHFQATPSRRFAAAAWSPVSGSRSLRRASRGSGSGRGTSACKPCGA